LRLSVTLCVSVCLSVDLHAQKGERLELLKVKGGTHILHGMARGIHQSENHR